MGTNLENKTIKIFKANESCQHDEEVTVASIVIEIIIKIRNHLGSKIPKDCCNYNIKKNNNDKTSLLSKIEISPPIVL